MAKGNGYIRSTNNIEKHIKERSMENGALLVCCEFIQPSFSQLSGSADGLQRFCFSEIVIIFRHRHNKKQKSLETYTTLPGTDASFLRSGPTTS